MDWHGFQDEIEKAIKNGEKLEIRTSDELLEKAGLPKDIFYQGNKIIIDEILRSHSINGTIDGKTIKSIWKK